MALAESVSIQSVSLALQALHGQRPTWALLLPKLGRELLTGTCLGLSCGLLVGLVALVWIGKPLVMICILGGITGGVAAVSCGMVGGIPLLDLDYSEDSTAEVDANVVIAAEGGLVEVQATAERTPLSRAHLDELLGLAAAGIESLAALQDEAVATAVR